MKCIRRPLTPLDRMFQGPPLPYSPGSLKKKPPPPTAPGTESTPAKPKPPPDQK
jgi:hypothetical protein